jgi:hypothetical protein
MMYYIKFKLYYMLSLEEEIDLISIIPLELIQIIFYYFGGFVSKNALLIKKELKRNLIKNIYLPTLSFDEIIYDKPYTIIINREQYNLFDPQIQNLITTKKVFIYHIYIKTTKIYGNSKYKLELY